jgi:hypothetical protein
LTWALSLNDWPLALMVAQLILVVALRPLVSEDAQRRHWADKAANGDNWVVFEPLPGGFGLSMGNTAQYGFLPVKGGNKFCLGRVGIHWHRSNNSWLFGSSGVQVHSVKPL